MRHSRCRAPWAVATLFALLLGAGALPTHAETLIFSTADHPIYTRLMTRTQGWWTPQGHTPGNDNYLTGAYNNTIFRSFFSFDLASLDLTRQEVVAARLEVTRYEYGSLNPKETLGLFDVHTDPESLVMGTGSAPDIWEDLGTGKSYGMFEVLPYASIYQRWDTSGFDLNEAALEDITAAAGGWFSIGGSLQGIEPGEFFPRIFSASGGGPVQQLVIETVPIITPEPGSLALLVVGGLPLVRRLRRQSRAARA